MMLAPVLLLPVLSLPAAAQTAAAPPPFGPAGASTPTTDELKQRLSGKSFNVKYADGTAFRVDFEENGNYFVNVAGGGNVSGEWRVEDGELCTKRQGSTGCNEARVTSNELFLKRDSGEIIQYVPL